MQLKIEIESLDGFRQGVFESRPYSREVAVAAKGAIETMYQIDLCIQTCTDQKDRLSYRVVSRDVLDPHDLAPLRALFTLLDLGMRLGSL